MLSFFTGFVAENADFVELNSPIFAIDKDAPHTAGKLINFTFFALQMDV